MSMSRSGLSSPGRSLKRWIRRWRFSQWAWWRRTAPGHGCPYGDVHRRESRRGGRRPSTAAYLVRYTYVLDKFSGTISISQEALYRLYKDVFLEAARNGVRYLVVVNGHGGNVDLLRTAAREVAKMASLFVVLINWWVDLAKEARRLVLETPEGHAAEDETSEVMAAYPHLVREVPREVDEWVEARYAAFGREVNRLLYQRAVQG